MSRTKSWRLTLAGIVLLAAVAVGQAKVIVLGASVRAPAADGPGALRRVSRQADGGSDDAQSGYQMLDFAQYTLQNPPAAGQHAMQSFLELSEHSTPPRDPNSRRHAGDFLGAETSPTGTTDAGIALLILCGLAAYQLRRKQQLLKRLPFSP